MNGSLGNVIRSIRLTVTANCPMSLHTVICWLDYSNEFHPFYSSLLTNRFAHWKLRWCHFFYPSIMLNFQSYGYSTSDIIYHWQPGHPVTIDSDVHLAHFTVGEFIKVERTISLSTGNYSRLTAYFTFKRNLGLNSLNYHACFVRRLLPHPNLLSLLPDCCHFLGLLFLE